MGRILRHGMRSLIGYGETENQLRSLFYFPSKYLVVRDEEERNLSNCRDNFEKKKVLLTLE